MLDGRVLAPDFTHFREPYTAIRTHVQHHQVAALPVDRMLARGDKKLVHAGSVQAASEPGLWPRGLHEPVPGVAVGSVRAGRRQPLHLRRRPRQLGRLGGPVLTSCSLLAAASCNRFSISRAPGIQTGYEGWHCTQSEGTWVALGILAASAISCVVRTKDQQLYPWVYMSASPAEHGVVGHACNVNIVA